MDETIAKIRKNNVERMSDDDLKELRNWVNSEYNKRLFGHTIKKE